MRDIKELRKIKHLYVNNPEKLDYKELTLYLPKKLIEIIDYLYGKKNRSKYITLALLDGLIETKKTGKELKALSEKEFSEKLNRLHKSLIKTN